MKKLILNNNSPCRNILIFFFLILFSCAALSPIIYNPGFFNPDELQLIDYLSQNSFWQYLTSHVRLHANGDFGTPVRPFSFLVMGVIYRISNYDPFLIHLFSVILHTLSVYLFYRALIQFGFKGLLPILAAFICIISPLSLLAVGWSGAIMDQLYILFGIITYIFVITYIFNKNYWMLFGIFIFSSLSICSKESALVLPAFLIIFIILDVQLLKRKYFWNALIVMMLPIIIFLAYRFPALYQSFNGAINSLYTPSFYNIPRHLLTYFSYPFLYSLTEAGNIVFLNTSQILLGFAFHAALVLCLSYHYGKKIAILYLLTYFLFLLPVLTINNSGAHYLYGSSYVFSCAVAAILCKINSNMFLKAGIIVGMLLLIIHSSILQIYIFSVGTCFNRILISTESLYLSSGKPKIINFKAESDAVNWFLRVYAGRNTIGFDHPIEFNLNQTDNLNKPDSINLIINKQCVIYKLN